MTYNETNRNKMNFFANHIYPPLLIYRMRNPIFYRKLDVEFFIFNFDYGLWFLTCVPPFCWTIIFIFCAIFSIIKVLRLGIFQKLCLFWLRFGQFLLLFCFLKHAKTNRRWRIPEMIHCLRFTVHGLLKIRIFYEKMNCW